MVAKYSEALVVLVIFVGVLMLSARYDLELRQMTVDSTFDSAGLYASYRRQNKEVMGSFSDFREVPEPESMVLSLSYWEQMANALKNLFDLQCWASTVNISKVVMPAIEANNKSVFHLGLNPSSLKFDDLFDLEYWNRMSSSLGFSPLVPQQHFLDHASRDVVYVQLLNLGNSYGCSSQKALTHQKWYKYLQSHKFHIIKMVCIDFRSASSHIISNEAFHRQVLDGIAHNVTVLFSNWEGIRRDYRIALKGSKCACRLEKNGGLKVSRQGYKYAPNGSAHMFLPSKRISSYVQHFLSEYMSGERYIAVMLRTEKLFRNKGNKDFIFQAPNNNSCARDIVLDWRSMVEKNNLSKTLFFSDIGGHGSMQWNSPAALTFSQYIQSMLHVEMKHDDINSIFEKLTSSKDSVQIAMLHQQLVAHATCVVIVGGGSFQSQTFNMYAHNHKGQECYTVRIETCKTSYTHY